MNPHVSTVDLAAAAALTGIEPARIQFFRREFRVSFRSAVHGAAEGSFDLRELDLLRTLDRWVFAEGVPLAEVHLRLAGAARRACIVAITSGKGGVGKTTVALNLATALAASGRPTLLVDADMGMGNVHVFAGVNPKRTVVDLLRGSATMADVLAEGPGGLRILPGASGMTELADLDPAALASLIQEVCALAADYDAIVLDTGAGISSRVVEFLRVADEIVVVAIPDIASMLDAYGVIKVAHESQVTAQVRLLVNMVGQGASPTPVADRIRGCARRFLGLELALLGWLTQDGSLQDANQRRQPVVLAQPDSASAQTFRRMAAALMAGHTGEDRMRPVGHAPGGGVRHTEPRIGAPRG